MRTVTCLGILFVFLCLARGSAIAASPLSAQQQKNHDEIKAGLESVEAALADARAKFAAGDTSGATADYGAAVRNYNKFVGRLGQVPSNEPTGAALRAQGETLGAKLKETAAALRAAPSNQPAAKPADKPAAPAVAPGAGLGYQGREKLKNVQYYLKEVDPRASRIAELIAGKIDAEAIAEATEHMTFIRQRLGYVLEHLNGLPADSAEVQTERKRYDESLAKLETAKSAIDKAAPEAGKQTAALEEQKTSDLAMVDSWSKSLGDPAQLFTGRPDDAIVVIGQLPQMREAMAAMLKRWTARATEKPDDQVARQVMGKLSHVDGQLTGLEKYTKEQATGLPRQITTQIDELNSMIQTAVTEKRPAYFGKGAGVPQKLSSIESSVTMLKAIDPAGAERAAKSLAEARQKSSMAQKSLAQDIIASNKKLPERYTGPDVEDLRQRVLASWKDAHPSDQVIAVVFNTEGWNRTTRWEWNKSSESFSKVDYDHIQPKLFYKLNDQHAVEQPVDIYKDYMKDGRIAIKPWDREADPPVSWLYLLENVK